VGTDRVQLFDKGIADRVLAMDREALEAFVSENLSALRAREFGYASHLFYLMDKYGLSVRGAFERLFSDGPPFTPLPLAFARFRTEVALDAALGGDEMAVDYWGCYVETLESAKGMLSCIDYMGMEEEVFVLLGPEHVDLMLSSLEAHASVLRIMRPEHVARLRRWRDECAANPTRRVAYFLGF
jgi:hypothetical protein